MSLIYAQHLRENSCPNLNMHSIYTPKLRTRFEVHFAQLLLCEHGRHIFVGHSWRSRVQAWKKEIALRGRVGQEEEKASERCRSGLYDIQRRAAGSKATGRKSNLSVYVPLSCQDKRLRERNNLATMKPQTNV